MSRLLFYKKYLQANYVKIILPYLIMLVFLMIFQGYFAFYNGTSKEVEKSVLQEKDLITIHGNTANITLYNVYDRLKEKTNAKIIPYVKDSLKIDDVFYTVIATNEDYLNYFIDEDGSYNNYEFSFDNETVNNESIILNKKAFNLISNTNILINEQNFNIQGYYNDSDDEPTILMNYKLYDQYITSISEKLLDGEKTYYFSTIYVISNKKDILRAVEETYDYQKNENLFTIVTFDKLFDQLMIDKGIGNQFTKNMMIFVFISMILVLSFIIGLSYKRNKNEYLLRKIIGESNKSLFIEFMIENLVVQFFIFILSIILIIITTMIVSQFYDSMLLPTFKQQIFILGGTIIVNQLLSAIIFQILIPRKNIILRR